MMEVTITKIEVDAPVRALNMRPWYITLNGQPVDTVWFKEDLGSWYVKRTLIERDGYPEGIQVSTEVSTVLPKETV